MQTFCTVRLIFSYNTKHFSLPLDDTVMTPSQSALNSYQQENRETCTFRKLPGNFDESATPYETI